MLFTFGLPVPAVEGIIDEKERTGIVFRLVEEPPMLEEIDAKPKQTRACGGWLPFFITGRVTNAHKCARANYCNACN